MTVTRERLYLFDTPLRDGAQTHGVDFSVEDKRCLRYDPAALETGVKNGKAINVGAIVTTWEVKR